MSAETQVFLSIYIFAFLISFPNSTLALCCCALKLRRKPLPIDIIMLNLVVSDLAFLIFLPVKMKEAADGMFWKMPYVLCHINLFLFFLPIYSSSLFLAAISAERYVCVAFPVKYKNPRRNTYTILMCVGIWLLVLVLLSMAYKIVYLDSNEAKNITNHTQPLTCFTDFGRKQLKDLLKIRLTLAMVFYCLPLIVCCFCYIKVIYILSKLPLIQRCRKIRAIGLALGTLLVFVICFAPFSVSHVVGYIRQDNPSWRMKALMVTTLNTCFDPIIFYCISGEMRGAFKVCLNTFLLFYNYLKRVCCCRPKQHGTNM